MRPTTKLMYALVALVLISCTNTTATQPTPTIMIAPTTTPMVDESHDVVADIAANHKRWKEANIRDYRFGLMVGCYCPMNAVMPITVEVRDSKVVSMIDANGVVISLDDPGADFFLKYTNINRVYTELTSAWFREADKLNVTFDPTYPVPATVSADFIEMAVDDELYLAISDFAVISE